MRDRVYIFRDVYSGRIFKVRATSVVEAKVKVARATNIQTYNLAHIQKQVKYA
jgi:hypothetical protein